MHALVPGVNIPEMALTALRTLELGNVEGGSGVDTNDAIVPAQPQFMDLRGLGLDSLKLCTACG